MRSRFSAFAVGHADYLLESWHPSTRPAALELDSELRWYRLEFEAHYRSPAGAGSQRGNSCFVLEDGLWNYLRARS